MIISEKNSNKICSLELKLPKDKIFCITSKEKNMFLTNYFMFLVTQCLFLALFSLPLLRFSFSLTRDKVTKKSEEEEEGKGQGKTRFLYIFKNYFLFSDILGTFKVSFSRYHAYM